MKNEALLYKDVLIKILDSVCTHLSMTETEKEEFKDKVFSSFSQNSKKAIESIPKENISNEKLAEIYLTQLEEVVLKVFNLAHEEVSKDAYSRIYNDARLYLTQLIYNEQTQTT